MSETESPSAPELIHFTVEGGAVSGEATQEQTEGFAADLQGLRHFARRLGMALDLGEPWHGAYREVDFTHLWACTSKETDDKAPAQGATIGTEASYFEVISHLLDSDD
jgi:hypothetical protein